MKLAEAVDLAGEYVEWLRDCCLRIEVVGSVKRGDKAEMHDIEILLIADPTAPRPEFGQKVIYKNRLEERLAQLVCEGLLGEAQKKANGDKLKRFSIMEHSMEGEEFCLELFIVRHDTWGIQNVIRTGPLEFSKRFVTNRAHMGLLPDNLQYIKGETRIIDRGTQVNLYLPEEADALAILELGWIEPGQRYKYSVWDNPLLERAIVFIRGLEEVSVSTLQRQFRAGYMTAARLLEEMEARHLITRSANDKAKFVVVKN